MNLFAYGSWMMSDGLRSVLGPRVSALGFRPALLTGWRWIWNVHREEWSGAVLNLERHPDGRVWGVLTEDLDDDDWIVLNAQDASRRCEQVWVEPAAAAAVSAALYWTPHGTSTGPVSVRYLEIALVRAAEAGPQVLENLCNASVDGAGEPLQLSGPDACAWQRA